MSTFVTSQKISGNGDGRDGKESSEDAIDTDSGSGSLDNMASWTVARVPKETGALLGFS